MKSLDKVIKRIEEGFLDTPVEITLISTEFSIRRLIYITGVELRGGSLHLTTNKTNYASLLLDAVEEVHYYGPGSLVFITKKGATLTLRPAEDILKFE
ncbi:hypothetical protein PM10SUCC1_10040 [Propionigenium maris DSM 9537]|uniref:Uncharacterized protein n=1 Tax=Propionigenium maris DSM 9537 TaxID=1123000 RepID=A0A9W6LN34_9FUSO|nr:hypothetical protein [Propionigenium maris]GLI55490.1 hypothetical protein PM10SUCC1_10040 [Propionigenium maris DSM 9537]